MSIVDDLCSAPNAHWLRRWCGSAQIIQVPFRVYPGPASDFDWRSLESTAGLMPPVRGRNKPAIDLAYSTEFSNPPFERLVMFGPEPLDPGMLLVHTVPFAEATRLGPYGDNSLVTSPADGGKTLRETFTKLAEIDAEDWMDLKWVSRIRAVGRLKALDGRSGFIAQSCVVAWGKHHVLARGFRKISDYGTAIRTDRSGRQFRDLSPEHYDEVLKATRRQDAQALSWLLHMAAAQETAQIFGTPWNPREHLRFIKDYITLDMADDGADATSRNCRNWPAVVHGTYSLLNCKNVVMVKQGPPWSRAAKRRGDAVPYRYSVIKVRPNVRRATPSGDADAAPVAIHWVRGHFKNFTEAAPLFGRLAGLFWWQPHLAGRKHGTFGDKQYALPDPRG